MSDTSVKVYTAMLIFVCFSEILNWGLRNEFSYAVLGTNNKLHALIEEAVRFKLIESAPTFSQILQLIA